MGGHIEVTVNASQGQGQSSLSDTDVRDGYMIRGENPSSDTIVANTDNDWERAMVWQESGDESQGSQPEQFNEPAPGFLNVNLADNPPGWGLTQITHPIPNRLQVWNWFENLAEGIERLEECRENAAGRNVTFYSQYQSNAHLPDWDWDPTDPDHVYDGTHVDELQDFTSEQITSEKIHWLEAYFRYNSSVNSMFDPDGTFRASDYGSAAWNEAWNHTFTFDENDGDLENSYYSTYRAQPWS